MDLTVEIYRLDRRVKGGRRLAYTVDLTDVSLAQAERLYPQQPRYEREIHETWVTRRNLMGGAEYRERYDTPNFCSPASESYWSM